MKIASSAVGMAASRVSTRTAKVSIQKGQVLTTMGTLKKLGLELGDVENLDAEQLKQLQEESEKDLEESQKRMEEEAKKNMVKSFREHYIQSKKAGISKFQTFDSTGDRRLDLLRMMIEALTGKKIKTTSNKTNENGNGNAPVKHNTASAGNPDDTRALLAFSSFKTEYYEYESVSFSAEASVKTEDGREINISIGLNMSRELYEKFEIAGVSVMEFTDPLVINFDAAFAQLSDKKIEFDLDCDGTSDQISMLSPGSGFLAVDDGSGKVNDGSQLFGTKSGNGFADLAKHDGDSNGWIDENDAIWDKLRIWVHDESGESRLIGLGEVGIGAIFLGNATTDFTLAGDGGDVNGMLRRTGFFLKEDGGAGTVQHLDLRI